MKTNKQKNKQKLQQNFFGLGRIYIVTHSSVLERKLSALPRLKVSWKAFI